MDSNRFLRSPDLRAVLYDAADGQCQNCGDPLEDGWHADHIEPWSVTHRTNIFEMQALCPACNIRKGTKMTNDYGFSIDLSQAREGQREAIDTIVTNVRRGKKHTAIVLPPRVGKSDVARVSSVILMLEQRVSRAIILEPAARLRNQIVDKN